MNLATLSLRAVATIQSTRLSIDVENVLSMRFDLPDAKYSGAEVVLQFYSEFIRRTTGLPGAEGVAVANRRPLADAAPTRPVEVFGQPGEGESGGPTAAVYVVSSSYVDAMHIPLLRGRDITDDDAVGSQLVALVSRETVRRYFREAEPVGQRIRLTGARDAQWIEVVGVVEDLVIESAGRSPTPAVYLPFAQHPQSAMTAVVRSAGDPLALVAPVRALVRAIDPEQPIDDVRTLQRAMHDNRIVGQAVVVLFVALALFALMMATVGVYGVMAYAVSQQTKEIGIRMALGAEARTVRMLLLKQGGGVIVWSVALGLVGGYGVNRVYASVAAGVKLLDPVAFVAVPAILAAVGLAAILVPGRRAIKVDPMAVLRTE
jgi:putative ABC transport system permease protein